MTRPWWLLLALSAVAGCGHDDREPIPTCPSSSCLEVPRGVFGLGFGMSLEEVRARIGQELHPRDLAAVEPTPVDDKLGALLGVEYNVVQRVRRESYIPLAGTAAPATLSLGDRPASCLLGFADQGRLSSIHCSTSIGEVGLRTEIALALRDSLYQKYGAPDEVGPAPYGGGPLRGHYEWRDRAATLRYAISSSSLVLENQSAAHDAAVSGAALRASLGRLDRLLEAAGGRERANAVRAAREAFERDLVGAAESGGVTGPIETPRPEPAPLVSAYGGPDGGVSAAPGAGGAGAIAEGVTFSGELASEGSPDAPVTIVFGFDFGCPFCARAHRTLETLLARYGDRVRVVYTGFRVVGKEQAATAAAALCAASRQGAARAMNALLWAEPERWRARQPDASQTDVLVHARELRLDEQRFTADLAGCTAIVEREQERWQADPNVRGVPFFIINGVMIRGAVPEAQIAAVIDAALAGSEVE
jgi:protein-disulfide isomerase